MTTYDHDDCIEIISVEVVAAARNAAFTRSASQSVSVGDDSECDVALTLPSNADAEDGDEGGDLPAVKHHHGNKRSSNGAAASSTAVTVERYVTSTRPSASDARTVQSAGSTDRKTVRKMTSTASSASRSRRAKVTHVQDKTIKYVVTVVAFAFIVLSFLLVTVTLSMSDHIDDLGG